MIKEEKEDEPVNEQLAELFELKYHEQGSIDEGRIRVLRVPNGWIYTQNSLGNSTSCFVPEYIPTPPPEKDTADFLDAQVCDFLNKTVLGDADRTEANKLIRQLLRRIEKE